MQQASARVTTSHCKRHCLWEGDTGRIRQPGYRPTTGRGDQPRCIARACGEAGVRTRFVVPNMFISSRNHTARALCLSSLASAGAITAAQAQSAGADAAQLEPVIVTATRTARPVDSVLPSATLITNQDVQANLSSDLPTLLQQDAGIEFARGGGLGQQTSLFMRGGNSSHTLVLVDGVPVNTLSSMLPSVDFIPTEQIDHIEVVRGNVSSLYGSNAMGGVVQIFTRRGEDGFHPFASITVGKSALLDTSLGMQGGEGRLHYSFAASNLHTAGINTLNQAIYPDTNPDRDGYSNRSTSACVQWQTMPGHELALSYSNATGLAYFDNTSSGTATERDVSHFSLEQTSISSRDRFSSVWRSTLTLSNTIDANHSAMDAYEYFSTTSANHIEWQNDLRLTDKQTLTLAAGHQEQKLDADTTYDQTHRNVTSARAGYESEIGAFQLQANLRRDSFSDFGGANTGFLGAGVNVATGWKWIATASTGFSAPSFNDLYYPGFSNPDLHAEKARSAEMGVQWQSGPWHVRSVLFKTRYTDLIAYDATAMKAFNVGRATVQGWETAWHGAWEKLKLQGMLTLQNPTNDTDHTRLLRRARQLVSVSAWLPAAGFDWGLGLRAYGSRADTYTYYDSSFQPHSQSKMLGGYGLLDISMSHQLANGWTLRARLDNLTDKRYETIYGYNQPGRAFYVSLGWQGQ